MTKLITTVPTAQWWFFPQGGGKTYTAVLWLLKNAVNKHKKVLWIAHRQMLLDQAAEAFQEYAYGEVIPNISSFSYRIVSGNHSRHERTNTIKPGDNVLIISKDSLGRRLERIDRWLEGEKELYFVIDEAHHSTAKTYRKIIDYLKSKNLNLKLIGLTATPFRTAESEQELLARIFTDGIKGGRVIHGDVGISYQISLKELINRRILSKPIFESCYTKEEYGANLGAETLKKIYSFDLPEDIKDEMAKNSDRNALIVNTYKKKQEKYGQTIVFALNKPHAVQLKEQFRNADISADYIISGNQDMITGATDSEEINRKIDEYKEGKLQVLINVNILTEGFDTPKTKTVFLTRPTVSSVLMTQMVGRALRGKAAGGTSEAYIVSFIDRWNEKIA